MSISSEPTDQPASATSPERVARRSPFTRRIITGILGASGYLVAVFSDQVFGNISHEWPSLLQGLPFALGVAVFSIIGVDEFYRAVRRQGDQPSDFLGYVACIIFQLVAWRRAGSKLDPYLPALLCLLLLITLLVELAKKKHKPILSIGATLLGALYVGWLFSYLTLLHGLNVIVRP